METLCLILSIAALLISIGVVLWVKNSQLNTSKSVEVEKITLPGYEVKVINGELSFTPKK